MTERAAGAPNRGCDTRGARRPAAGPQRGMVTVELAFAVLAAAVVAAGCLWLAGAAFQLGHCQTTANEVARQHARGDAAAVRRATADAPLGARVEVRRASGATVVVVSVDVRAGAWSLPVSAEATVIDEVAR